MRPAVLAGWVLASMLTLMACLVEHTQLSLEEAASRVVQERLVEIRGDGGLIAVDAQGNIAMPFNTQRMFRACVRSGMEPVIRT